MPILWRSRGLPPPAPAIARPQARQQIAQIRRRRQALGMAAGHDQETGKRETDRASGKCRNRRRQFRHGSILRKPSGQRCNLHASRRLLFVSVANKLEPHAPALRHPIGGWWGHDEVAYAKAGVTRHRMPGANRVSATLPLAWMGVCQCYWTRVTDGRSFCKPKQGMPRKPLRGRVCRADRIARDGYPVRIIAGSSGGRRAGSNGARSVVFAVPSAINSAIASPVAGALRMPHTL